MQSVRSYTLCFAMLKRVIKLGGHLYNYYIIAITVLLFCVTPVYSSVLESYETSPDCGCIYVCGIKPFMCKILAVILIVIHLKVEPLCLDTGLDWVT